MGAVRHLQILAPLALVAGLLAACGHDSSSSSVDDTTIAPASAGFEVRPVYARYIPGVPSVGRQLSGDLLDAVKAQRCPIKPHVVQSMLLECDARKAVYLLQNPIVSGDVATATAKQVGGTWYVRIGLDDTGTKAMDSLIKDETGLEVAFSYGGEVLTSLVVNQGLHPDRLALIGDFDKAQATNLASKIAG